MGREQAAQDAFRKLATARELTKQVHCGCYFRDSPSKNNSRRTPAVNTSPTMPAYCATCSTDGLNC